MNDDRQELVGRIAATLGHELRNPLASALAGAMLVRDMLDQDDPRTAIVDGVLEDIERTSRLLTSYLDCARNGKLQREATTLAAICEAVACRHIGTVQVGNGLDVEIAADRLLLERAVENLVENARHAGASTVTLGACMHGDRVQFAVEDDGPGVPADLCERIFEPGFSPRGSTGLGLAIVAQTIRAHGGSVRCAAQARGSCFVIELPALRSRCLELA